MKFTIICKTKDEKHLEVLQKWGEENGYVVNENRTRHRIMYSNFTGLGFAASSLDKGRAEQLQSHLQDRNIESHMNKENLLSRFMGTVKHGSWLIRLNIGFMFLYWLGSIASLIYGISTADENLLIFIVSVALTTGWFFFASTVINFVPTFLVEQK